jgi:nucleoside 2-deoxyribosyltransferase
MRALGKPLAGWTRDIRAYPAKVAQYFERVFGIALSATEPGRAGGTSGTMRDPDGILVHSETCLQNAMVHLGIESAGGHVAAHLDWEIAFAQAAQSLAGRLSR